MGSSGTSGRWSRRSNPVWWLFYKLHALIVGGVRALAALFARTVGRFLLAVWLLVHEEVRRYIGLAVWGVVLVLLGRATLNYIPAGEVGAFGIQADVRTPLLLVNLGLLGIWAAAVKRAIRLTRHNSLLRVQQRKEFRELRADVKGARQDMGSWMARATRNTPARKVFRSNREDIAKEQERAAKAAAEAEERAAQEAFLDSLPPDHDPYVRSR